MRGGFSPAGRVITPAIACLKTLIMLNSDGKFSQRAEEMHRYDPLKVHAISHSNLSRSPLHVHFTLRFGSCSFSLPHSPLHISPPPTLFIARQLPPPVFAHACESWPAEGRHLICECKIYDTFNEQTLEIPPPFHSFFKIVPVMSRTSSNGVRCARMNFS